MVGKKCGLEGLDDLPDALASEHPVLASCYGASAGNVQLLGDNSGQRVDRLSSPFLPTPSIILDALAYLSRPPVAQDRLFLESDNMVRYDFKTAWKDGTRAVRLQPLVFLARLAVLVSSTLRYSDAPPVLEMLLLAQEHADKKRA